VTLARLPFRALQLYGDGILSDLIHHSPMQFKQCSERPRHFGMNSRRNTYSFDALESIQNEKRERLHMFHGADDCSPRAYFLSFIACGASRDNLLAHLHRKVSIAYRGMMHAFRHSFFGTSRSDRQAATSREILRTYRWINLGVLSNAPSKISVRAQKRTPKDFIGSQPYYNELCLPQLGGRYK
jgi:hypothetical protein